MSADEHTCDVCRLLDGDSAPKAGTRFCSACSAWICPACAPKLGRRARAMMKRGMEKARAGSN